MPPELMELYNLYKQELETRSTKENQFVEELNNEIIRVCECKIALNLKCIDHTWADPPRIFLWVGRNTPYWEKIMCTYFQLM